MIEEYGSQQGEQKIGGSKRVVVKHEGDGEAKKKGDGALMQEEEYDYCVRRGFNREERAIFSSTFALPHT